jgi:hypothetical protein
VVYVFWAHLVVWILVSFYMLVIQRRLAFMELRVNAAEERLKEDEEGEA